MLNQSRAEHSQKLSEGLPAMNCLNKHLISDLTSWRMGSPLTRSWWGHSNPSWRWGSASPRSRMLKVYSWTILLVSTRSHPAALIRISRCLSALAAWKLLNKMFQLITLPNIELHFFKLLLHVLPIHYRFLSCCPFIYGENMYLFHFCSFLWISICIRGETN